jgi:integrase
VTIATTSRAKPWTTTGFNANFIMAIAKLAERGLVQSGLTFHDLRHTVGTLLIEAGHDINTVRRRLSQKTLAMAIHYSETADTSARMKSVVGSFHPIRSKQ